MTSAKNSKNVTANAESVDRIAVDNSIWMRALFFGGSAEELIKMALTGKVQILTTESEFLELARILEEKLAFSAAAIEQVRLFVESVTSILPSPEIPAAGPGAGFSPFLLAARDSQASAIATSDPSSLKGLEDFEGIPIVTVS